MMTSKRMILGVLALGLLGTGCQPECVDPYDCLSAHGNPSPGKRYTCQAQRCEQVDLVAPEPGEADAGTDAGVDAGTDAGVDAGMDAGTDAGVTCADLPHDAKLGTLKLQTGFSVGESATLSGDIIAVTTLQKGAAYQVYGVNGVDRSVYALGTWPAIAASTTPMQPIVPAADRSGTLYLSSFLTQDGSRLLAGYTKLGSSFSDVPGKVMVHDLGTPANSTYVSAEGNFAAAAVPGAFLINGLGLEGVTGSGGAVYALKTDVSPFVGSRLATFPEAGAYSGYTAVTSAHIAVLAIPSTRSTPCAR